MEIINEKTGYPSIDKPWIKYYSQEAVTNPLPRKTMFQLVWDNNSEHPNDIALRYFQKKITYRSYFDGVVKTVNALHASGIKKGDIVTIMSMQTPETIYLVYALNYIGAIANMIYITASEKEILNAITRTNSKLLFVLDIAAGRIKEIQDKIPCPVITLKLADSMPALNKILMGIKKPSPNSVGSTWSAWLKKGTIGAIKTDDYLAPAVIVYTSGTTGVSKGVVLSSNNLNALSIQCCDSGKNYKRGEKFLNNIPPFLGYGIGMIHLPLIYGVETTLHLKTSPQEIAKGIAKVKPNHYAGGPPVIDPLMKIIRGDMSWMIDFTGGGDALSPEKEREFNQFLEEHGSPSKFCMGYGMSELSSVISMQQNHAYRFGSVGLVLPKSNIKIIDTDTGKELKYGEVGEMCFESPNLMIGYFENEEETKAVIEIDKEGKRWIHTGDLGFVDEDGYIFYKGRIKRIYLTAGKSGDIINKIFPQQIENCMEEQKNVEACGVIVVEDKIQLNIPIAFITLKQKNVDQDTAINELKEASTKTLPEHMWPARIHIIDEMPYTQNGKIDYHKLEKMEQSL